MNFDDAADYFKDGRIRELSLSDEGRRFLKLCSLSRKDYMKYLIEKHQLGVNPKDSSGWLKALFESNMRVEDIDEAILHLHEQERSARRDNEAQLIDELGMLQSFEWGGLHQNSLEKAIVDNYVKKITSYRCLSGSIEGDLHKSMRAYVLASWYNHWTSIMIEDIFNDHEKVIPAIARIKKIDFFINNKPFDLKVTYLPEGYIKCRRRAKGLKAELTLMRRKCKDLGIEFDKNFSDSVLTPVLWQKLNDHAGQEASALISDLQKCREGILQEAMTDPVSLMRWLYENQGTRRFDSSSRIFLILVDKGSFFDSWKLKRMKPFLSDHINSYLNGIGDNIGAELTFQWGEESYTVESAAIFAIKD